ncbi:MAG: DUF3568 family protein [Planctomycetes bacterium]|nr:DUF3568 family protein [Planctomycetota bacterium]
MKKVVLLLALFVPGCLAAVVIGIIAAGVVAVGTYSYVNNVLIRNYDAALDSCWEAVRRTVKFANLPTEKEAVDMQRGEVRSRMADGRRVVIALEKLTDKSTKVSVTVGDFEKQDNREAAQKIHEEVYHQLTGKYEREQAGPDAAANTITEEHSAPYDRVWEAAIAGVKNLGFQAVAQSRDALKGIITCKRADGTAVEVIVEKLDKGGASVQVRVGTARSEENARAGRAVQTQIREGLK